MTARSICMDYACEKTIRVCSRNEGVIEMAEEQLDWGKVKEFAGLMLNDMGAAMQGALTYIGDRLGIFKALAAAGSVTSAELANRSGLNERYLREWLGAMTAAKYVTYDPASGRYTM